jgi:hypothetical protein
MIEAMIEQGAPISEALFWDSYEAENIPTPLQQVRGAILAWADTYHLSPFASHKGGWVCRMAWLILQRLSHDPTHHAKGLWWLLPKDSYVGVLLKLPPSVEVKMHLLAPDVARDRTYERYRKRPSRRAREVIEAHLKAAWDRAVAIEGRATAPEAKPVMDRSPDDEALRWATYARYLCLGETPEQAARNIPWACRDAISRDPSALYRWVSEAGKLLGLGTRRPGRPRKL